MIVRAVLESTLMQLVCQGQSNARKPRKHNEIR